MKLKQLLFTLTVMLSCFVVSVNAQVAKIGSTDYATLEAAMTACVAGDNTITLLENNAEVFTFAQKTGVNITIDGEGKTFSGKITLSTGGGNLTFTDAKIAPANSQTIYLKASTAPNIVFDGCTLQGANKSGTIVYGYASATSNSVSVKNCTADNLQYIVSHRQTGSSKVTIENVTATNMIYLVRTLKCPTVTIKNVTCDAVIGVDIKNDGAGGKLTLEDVNINVVTYGGTTYYPVSGSGAGASWTITLKGTNTFSKNGVKCEGNDWFSGNDGYKIVDANVAKIGEKGYATLEKAIADATSNVVITLQKDVIVTNTIVIPTGKSITFDLNSKTISQEKACTASYQMIENNGSLTITGNGKISFKDTGAGDPSFGWGSYTIRNAGNLVVENGTIEHLGEQNKGNGQPNVHMYCAIFQYSGSTTINGGTISTPTYRSARLWKGDMTINGGTFEGQLWLQAVDNTANLTINGGTFAPRGNDGSSVYVENSSKTVKFEVTGGTFETKIGVANVDALTGAIKGGKFSASAKENTNDKLINSEVNFGEANNGYFDLIETQKVAKIDEQKYATLADALAAATAGQTITFLADVTENVTISTDVTIDGAGNTYTGAMELKADATIKNLNFDGKGYNGYAITTRGAQYLTIEGCTAKNYGYGFVQLASGTALTTVKNVTVSNVNYGVKVDYSNAVVLENADITAGVAAVLNSNYGEKTITIKDSKLNILGTWTRNNTTKTNYVFEGANTIGKFVTEAAIDNFKLAAEATLTAPEEIIVTADKGYKVEYADGKYFTTFVPAGKVAYRADVTDKADREGIAVLLKEVYAKGSLVVKVYNNETLMFTCTRRDIDDEGKEMFPVMGSNTTANIVIWGKESGSWINEIHAKPTNKNVPNKIEIIADGVVVETYTHESGTVLGTNLEKYLALDCVEKTNPIAKIGEQGYETLAEAVEIAQVGETITLIADATGAGVVINKDVTIDFAGFTYTFNKAVGSKGTETLGFQILKGNNVTLKNGTLTSTTVVEGKEVKVLVQNYANTLNIVDMNLFDATEHIQYALSNNNGTTTLSGATNITTDAVAFDSYYSKYYDAPTVTVETTGTISGKIEKNEGATIAIKGGTYTVDVTEWCAKGYVCKKNADDTFGVEARKVVKVGNKYYNSLRAAVDEAPAGATVELLEDVTLEGGYEDSTEGLRIEKALLITGQNGKNRTINCGTFKKGIRVYNNTGNKATVTFRYLTIVNDNVEGRCIDTRSGNIDLLLYVTQLKATGTNSQPLTLGGNDRMYRVRIQGSTIDAGKTGYGVICFVPSWAGITASTGTKISGYSAFYLKEGTNNTTISLDKGTYTGTNTFAQNSGVFGTIVVEGDNNIIKVVDPNTVVKAISADGIENADQAAFLIAEGATGNKIQITSAKVTTEGTQAHLAMVDADVAESTSFVMNGENMQLAAECNGYQFIKLDDAFRFADDNSTIKLLSDVNYTTANYVTDCDGYASIINVEGRTLTLDLNGKTITVDANAADLTNAKGQMLMAVLSTDDEGHLILTDSSENKAGTVQVTANDATVYSLVTNYEEGCTVTINGGNYIADKLGDSMLYSGVNEGITVNDGNFNLGNVGTGSNGKPWIFNVLSSNEGHSTVNGGTFNTDVNHQFWGFEVKVPNTLALKDNENGTWTVVNAVAYVAEIWKKWDREVGYASIEEAISAVSKYNCTDNAVTLVSDLTITQPIAIATEVVLNLNGKTIEGTDNATASYGLINIKSGADLTINGEGAIKLTATNNRGWNAYSSVISNQRGKLTVNGGIIEHLGGTDMAYAIDNLTNGKGTYAETVINGGTIKSTYRAIRQFLNGTDAENILTVKGGVIEGANKSIWMQDPSKNANTGTLYVAEDAELKGDVYLTVTAGSTEWPVEVEIAKAALVDTSTVLSSNVPEGYAVSEYPTAWIVEALNLADLTIVDGDYSEYINVTEKNVGRLTYERNFENADWQTLYLPFEVPYANLKNQFDVAYIYNAAYKEGEIIVDQVILDEDDANFVLAANYPYLIKAKETGYKEIVVDSARLMITDVDTINCSSVFETFSFIGNYATIAADTLDATKGYFELNGNWNRMDELNPFRVYMQIEMRNGEDFEYPTVPVRMRRVDENGNVDINDLNGEEMEGQEGKEDMIFDLNGRRISEPVKGFIYIINGQKVLY